MGDMTLRSAVEEYKDIYMASRNFAPRTRVEYLHDVEDLIGFLVQLGLKEVTDIGLPQLERYLAELDRRGSAGSTRKRKVISIRSFLLYLYQNQYIRINLAKKLIPPFAEAGSPRYLSKIECERLLLACAHNPRDSALIQLILQTGIKLSEVTRLTTNNLELPFVASTVGYLHILGSRTTRERVIPLKLKTCKSLTAYLKEKNTTSNIALFTNRFGHPLSPRGVEKTVTKYMLKLGIKDANIQSLRHTFAVHNLASGMNLKTIQGLMGYCNNHTPAIYQSIINGKS
jgi:site-specific recombinase XerD